MTGGLRAPGIGSCWALYITVLSADLPCAAAARNAAVSDGSLAGRGAGMGVGVGVDVGAVTGAEAGDCTGAAAGFGASEGSGLDGRAPPPMSSSAVQGRSLITSSRLSENRSSSSPSNMWCTCPPIAGVTPRPVHDALLNAILFHPFEMLIPSIIWNLLCSRVSDSCIPELAPKRGGATRRTSYLSLAAALASLR